MSEPLDDLTVAAAQMKTKVERQDFISDGWVIKWRLVIESHLPTIQQNAEDAKRLGALERAMDGVRFDYSNRQEIVDAIDVIRLRADEILREGEGL